jgi:hypothetical protein
MRLKDTDNELKEALVLLTNNYTAELQAIRHHQVKSLISVIDSDIALLNKYKEILIKLDNIQESISSNKFSFRNIVKSIGVGMVVITFFTALYHYEPEAVTKAVDAVKSFSSIGVRVIKDFD